MSNKSSTFFDNSSQTDVKVVHIFPPPATFAAFTYCTLRLARIEFLCAPPQLLTITAYDGRSTEQGSHGSKAGLPGDL